MSDTQQKIKIIAFIGESGCGKDSICKKLLAASDMFIPIVSYTTRPKRDNEIDGIDYHFITHKELNEKIINNQMYEVSCFNNWYYGTPVLEYIPNKIYIGVFNADGIRSMLEYPEIELMVYKLVVSPKERIKRQLDRVENPDIEETFRRYKTDLYDFNDLEFSFTELKNEIPQDIDTIIDYVTTFGHSWLKY